MRASPQGDKGFKNTSKNKCLQRDFGAYNARLLFGGVGWRGRRLSVDESLPGSAKRS
jgi:hypothetical protein